MTFTQVTRRFESCPRSHPRRGCRLVTALLLQRRSVEFDPPPRYQVCGTEAEMARHRTFNATKRGSSPRGPTIYCWQKRNTCMNIIDGVPVWGSPIDEGALRQ